MSSKVNSCSAGLIPFGKLLLCLLSNTHIIAIKTFFLSDAHLHNICHENRKQKLGTQIWLVCDAMSYIVVGAFSYIRREERVVGLEKHANLYLMESYKNT